MMLKAQDIRVAFPVRSGSLRKNARTVEVVSGVSFEIAEGEALGLVGESGCGKSTTARALCGLERIASGELEIGDWKYARSRVRPAQVARDVQMIFQDPYSSLNPRIQVGESIAEGWQIHRQIVPRRDWGREIGRLLSAVGLREEFARRYPAQLSGGERQRVAIARALAVRPRLLVCDEVVSALDVSVKAQLIRLFQTLRNDMGTGYLFISHDTSAVRQLTSRVLVMYLGKIVEMGKTEEVFSKPTHPYTSALLSAVPRLHPWIDTGEGRRRIVLEGELPSLAAPPSGCRFRTRCWKAESICAEVEPPLTARSGDTASACHFPLSPAEVHEKPIADSGSDSSR